MGKIAFIFPGQGSQTVGMGLDLYTNSKEARDIFDKADNILEKSISKICFEGPDEDLKTTINAQPAIVANSIAALTAFLAKSDIKADYVAGHSLGEYCAMYAAGVLSFENVMKAIQKRACVMNEAAMKTEGTMAAVLGLTGDKVQEVLSSLNTEGIVQVANFNSPEQVVITGEKEAVNLASETLAQAGAKRVIPLAVSGAFHSKLMESAALEFENFVKDLDLSDAKIAVITNVDAKSELNKENFRNKMPKQIYSSVCWTQTIENMISNGVDTFIEFGAGKVLAGLNKKINSTVKTYNVSDMASLNQVVEALSLQTI